MERERKERGRLRHGCRGMDAPAYAPSKIDLPKCSSHSFVVHRRSFLVLSPQSRHGLGVHQLENASLAIGPSDIARTVFGTVQQLKQELPQVGRAGAWTSAPPLPAWCRGLPGRRWGIAVDRQRRRGGHRRLGDRLWLQTTN